MKTLIFCWMLLKKVRAFEEDFAYSAMAEKYKISVFLDENGKPEEALAKKQRLVSALKKDFRKEIDI